MSEISRMMALTSSRYGQRGFAEIVFSGIEGKIIVFGQIKKEDSKKCRF